MSPNGGMREATDLEFARRNANGGVLYPSLFLIAVVVGPWQENLAAVAGVLLFFVAVAVLRWWWVRPFAERYAANPARASGVLDAMVLVNGLGWGVCNMLALFRFGLDSSVFVLLLFTAGLTGGATAAQLLRPRTLRAFLLAMLVPVGVGLLVSGGSPGIAINVSFLLYFAFLMRQARQGYVAWNAQLQTQAELRSARAEAERASLAKSEFLAVVSHEIRTPMNAVIGLSDVLAASDELSVEHHKAATTIGSSARSLLQLVNKILDFSSIAAGELVLEPTDVRLTSLFADLEALLATDAAAKNVGLRFELDEDMPAALRVDEHRLRQILLNLVGNALKFVSDGSVTVRATRSKDTCRVTVSDTGPGIDQETQAVLFEAFRRGRSRFGSNRGAGLGLVISRRLARAMGGDLVLESTSPEGTTFAFSFEAEVVANDDDATADAEAPRRTRPLALGRVLVVDDDPINRTVLRTMLRSLGVEDVSMARNGLEAVDAVKPGAFDVVLMDLYMPELSGIEATKRIRDQLEEPPRILMLTGEARDAHRTEALEAGVDTFLTKPIELVALESALMETSRARPR